MAKPRLSEGRIPFQLGIDAIAVIVPIVNACATVSQDIKPLALLLFQAKPLAMITLATRHAALTQQIKPQSMLAQANKPIAIIVQRPC